MSGLSNFSLYVAKQDEAGLDRPREYDWWQCQWRTLGQVIQELSAVSHG